MRHFNHFKWTTLLLAAIPRMAEADGEPLGIMELDANLSDVEKPPELPPGAYIGEIQDVQKGVSGKGNEYFAVKFVIPQDEIPPDIAEHYDDGAIMYWNRQVIPTSKDRRALYNLRKFIESIGLDSNTTSIDPNDWMGCKAKLRVVHEKYQGESRASIKSLEPAEVVAAKASAARGKRK